MDLTIHKCVAEPRIVDAGTKHRVDASTFTFLMDSFIKHEVEKGSLKEARLHLCLSELAEIIDVKKNNAEHTIPEAKMDSVGSPSHSTDILDDEKMNSKSYSTFTTWDEWDARIYQSHRREGWSRHDRTCRHHRAPGLRYIGEITRSQL